MAIARQHYELQNEWQAYLVPVRTVWLLNSLTVIAVYLMWQLSTTFTVYLFRMLFWFVAILARPFLSPSQYRRYGLSPLRPMTIDQN